MTNFKKLPGIQLFSLKGKSAIITGGSKGLGFAMAAGLASAGANVMLVARNQEECEQSAKEIAEEYQVKAIGFSADVTQGDQMNAMAAKALESFGSIDKFSRNQYSWSHRRTDRGRFQESHGYQCQWDLVGF